jgi:hypothetical protein
MKQSEIDWAEMKRRAKLMTTEALHYARQDCYEAALAAEDLEAAGCRVSKTGGYYRDEASVYATEQRRRAH